MLKNYRFSPKLIPSLATLVLLPVLLSLGFWQLGRMHEKQTLLDAQNQGNLSPASDISALIAPAAYSKVEVRGKLLTKFSILLEHQMHDSQPGYHVLTPLEISPEQPWLWIDRGWVGRHDIPKEADATEMLTFTGLTVYPSENRFILGENFSYTENNQLKIQRIVWTELNQHVRHASYPYLLLLDPNSPQGFIRDWEIKTMPPSKHLGYAVQWFALAATLLGLYIIVNLRRKTKNDQTT